LPCPQRQHNHAALIDDENLVKILVQRLPSPGNDAGHLEDVGRGAQGFDKFESSAGVETSSRANRTSVTILRVMWNEDILIPSPDTVPRGQSLSNRRTRFFSPPFTPRMVVSPTGVLREYAVAQKW